MDSLNYNYPSSTNKLTYIDDLQTNHAAYANDLDNQVAGNYQYDQIGNLIKDVKEDLHLISWTNAQKIDTIYKDKEGNSKIWFNYDVMQNRVVKYIKNDGSLQERRTYYIRDAQGNVMATYSARVTFEDERITWDSLYLSEQHIYGSSRVGMALPNLELYPTVPENPNLSDNGEYPIFEGRKRYEISNHLGNVLSVITDRKRGAAVSGSQIQWFEADVVSAQQYYPFGMLMPGSATDSLRRQYTLGNNDYRYGFNGKEGDDEVKGDDNQQDYGMRIYDPRVGRFLSVDPIAREYPMLSSYQFSSNSPISGVDLDGLEFYYATDGTFLGNRGSNPMVRLINISDFTSIINGTYKDMNGQTEDNALYNASEGTSMKNVEMLRIAGLAYGETALDQQAMQALPNAVFNRHLYFLKEGARISFTTTINNMRANTNDDQEYNDKNGKFREFIGNDIAKTGIGQLPDLMKNAYGRNNVPLMKAAIQYTIDAYKFANGEGGQDYSGGAIGWHGLDILTNKYWYTILRINPADRNYGFQNTPSSTPSKEYFESTFSRPGAGTYSRYATVFYKLTKLGETKTALGNPKLIFPNEY